MSEEQLANEVVSHECVEHFHTHGYVVLRGFYDEREMRDLANWTQEVVDFPEVPGRHMVYYEDSLLAESERVLSRIENFCPYHQRFDAMLRGGRVMSSVAKLLGESAVLFKEKINFKMPGGDGFKAHQDVQAGWDTYADMHITMLLSIDPATTENGCLEIAPGQHRRGLLGELWKPLDDDIEGVEYVPLPTAPGDAVFFDSFIPHRSLPNLTSTPRRILYVTYNGASAGDHRVQYYADKRLSYPPDVERDPDKRYAFRV